jgi:hypothetical protein
MALEVLSKIQLIIVGVLKAVTVLCMVDRDCQFFCPMSGSHIGPCYLAWWKRA